MDQESLLRSFQLLIEAFPNLPHTQTNAANGRNKLAPSASSPSFAAQRPSFSHIRRLLSLPSVTDAQCEQLRQYLTHLLVLPEQQHSSTSPLPPHASPLLPSFPLTTHVIRLFRPLIATLLNELLRTDARMDSGPDADSSVDLQQRAVVLSHVTTLCPHVKGAVAGWLRRSPHGLFDSTSTAATSAASFPANFNASPSSLHLVYAAYRYLSVDFTLFQSLFRWSAVFPHLSSSCPLTRYYAARCVAAALRMNDVHQEKMMTAFGPLSTDSSQLPPAVIEQRQSEAMQAELAAVWQRATEGNELIELPPPAVGRLDVLLSAMGRPLSSQPSTAAAPFIPLSSTPTLLYSLCLFLTQPRPILLTGVPGSGKSHLVRHLHSLLSPSRHPLLTLHLSPSLDTKTLLGSYQSTDVPGEFRWEEGALTAAMRQGRWVLLEEVDRAGWEVVSGLRGLMERGEVEVRGETIRAAEGFRLFATRTGEGRRGAGWEMLSTFFNPVDVPAMTDADLLTLIQALYADIPAQHVQRVLSTYTWLTSSAEVQHVLGTRRLSTRDLFRWCRRLAVLFAAREGWNATGMNDEMMDRVLRSIVDVFLASISDTAQRIAALQHCSELWSIPSERIAHYDSHYKPHYELRDGSSLSIGAYTFAITATHHVRSRPFLPTRHALLLMEQLAGCITLNEPMLLVGDTGVGKTSILSHLAACLRVPLTVINLSQQSDTSDLLGGFKPYELSAAVLPLYRELVGEGGLVSLLLSGLSEKTSKENANFIGVLNECVQRKQWRRAVKGMKQAADNILKKVQRLQSTVKAATAGENKPSTPLLDDDLVERVDSFHAAVTRLDRQFAHLPSSASSASLPLFHFHEGALISALRLGHWVLLDEINLASADTLERLTSLLDSAQSSLALSERGDVSEVKRHPQFRLFAAMNPPDYGKKDLTAGIRNRLVELWVNDVHDKADLELITTGYLQHALRDAKAATPVTRIVDMYLRLKAEAKQQALLDGTGQPPHYSLRTYVRALSFTSQNAAHYSFNRALYEGFMMAFASPLSLDCKDRVSNELLKCCSLKSAKLKVSASSLPAGHLSIEEFHVPLGPLPLVDDSTAFIRTVSIGKRLKDIARVLVGGKHPILLQGPTSAGKTSLVTHLARVTGHRLVRINNHQHTDISEYLGSYVSNAAGALVYREGVLVEAVRKGWWIVLDELNLAPSEVLEALNRLLDDNRQLFLPETQETITAHERFQLFATQNPPGLYGGRKVLSKAFVNRFIVFHVDDLPTGELQEVIERRCALPATNAEKMIAVMHKLQQQRDSQSLFLGKGSLITVRDLFRWGERMKGAADNTLQTLAEQGYRLLGERLRSAEGQAVVRGAIEECMAKATVKIDTERMYSQQAVDAMVTKLTDGRSWSEVMEERGGEAAAMGLGRIAWTRSMRRMFILAAECVLHQEPLLLVGETGTGQHQRCARQHPPSSGLPRRHFLTPLFVLISGVLWSVAQARRAFARLVAHATSTHTST